VYRIASTAAPLQLLRRLPLPGFKPAVLVLQERRHIRCTQIDRRIIFEELVLGEIKDTIIGFNRIDSLFDLRVLVPTRTIIVKLAILNLATAPRISVRSRNKLWSGKRNEK